MAWSFVLGRLKAVLDKHFDEQVEKEKANTMPI